MDDLIFFLLISLIGWVGWRSYKQQPIIPFINKSSMKKRQNFNQKTLKKDGKNKKTIKELLGIEDIKYNMIWLPNNTYVMAIRTTPVNYHLRNEVEQEGIDSAFESWLVMVDFPFVFHVQSRYLDFKEQYEDYLKVINNDPLLTDKMKQYSYLNIEYMGHWLNLQHRFEQNYYVLFPFQLKDVTSDPTENALRAFQILLRRAESSLNQLENCGIEGKVCSTEDLAEMFYYSLNRKRASKSRFEDVRLREMLAQYCTAEQDEIRIKKVMDLVKMEAKKEQNPA